MSLLFGAIKRLEYNCCKSDGLCEVEGCSYPFFDVISDLCRIIWRSEIVERCCAINKISHFEDSIVQAGAIGLAKILSVPLWQDFIARMTWERPTINMRQSYSNENYKRYANFLRHGGLLEVLLKFELATRRSERHIEHWVNNYVNFILMYSVRFSQTGNLRSLDVLSPPRSDPHECGQTVLRVSRPAIGYAQYFKPRSLTTDLIFSRFLGGLNNLGFSDQLLYREPSCYDTYGWDAEVRHEAITTKCEVESYFRRAGAVLFAAYACRLVDLHSENVVSDGKMPQVIDAEAMFHDFSDHHYDFSVLDTGLLPPLDYSGPDIFGLTSHSLLPSRVNHYKWKNIGKDNFSPEVTGGQFLPQKNSAVVDEKLCSITDNADQFISGFNEAYDIASMNLEFFQHLVYSAIRKSKGLKTRLIVRPTLLYGIILEDILMEHYDSENSARRHASSSLSQSNTFYSIDSEKIVDSEVSALLRLDIPRFIANWADGWISESGNNIFLDDKVLNVDPLRMLRPFSQLDKKHQCDLIDKSLLQLHAGVSLQ